MLNTLPKDLYLKTLTCKRVNRKDSLLLLILINVLLNTSQEKDKIILILCNFVKIFSTCSRHQIGSVSVSSTSLKVFSFGYNGVAKGETHCCDMEHQDHRSWSSKNEIHAEDNVIRKLKSMIASGKIKPSESFRIFVTKRPCHRCIGLMNSFSKVKEIVYIEDWTNGEIDDFAFENCKIQKTKAVL